MLIFEKIGIQTIECDSLAGVSFLSRFTAALQIEANVFKIYLLVKLIFLQLFVIIFRFQGKLQQHDRVFGEYMVTTTK